MKQTRGVAGVRRREQRDVKLTVGIKFHTRTLPALPPLVSMYRFPTTCSKAVCPYMAYQISCTGPDRSDPIHSNNLLLDRPVQFYLDRAISNTNPAFSRKVDSGLHQHYGGPPGGGKIHRVQFHCDKQRSSCDK